MPASPVDVFVLVERLFHAIGYANLVTALIAVNFIAFALFGIDKARAETGNWRISEANLLCCALLGGTVGAYAGRAAFRHKTRKQPFSDQLHTIAGLQVVVLGLLVGWNL